jgi:hypothetical protein
MRLRPLSQRRRTASTLAESAIAHAVVVVLTVMVVVVALGVFAYQMVGELAREGARWASVHGGQYAAETGNAVATGGPGGTIETTAVMPKAVGLDTSQLQVSATSWSDPAEMPIYLSSGAVVRNYVTVTVQYNWVPAAYFSSMTISSTSTMPMQY